MRPATPREPVPGSRMLAQQLSLSRNTVNAALEQLTLEGYLLRNRLGTRVAQLAQRTLVQALPDSAVTLGTRVASLPAPVPRDTPVPAFTPGTPAIQLLSPAAVAALVRPGSA